MLFTYKNDTTIPYLQGQHHIRHAGKIDVTLKMEASPIKKGIFYHVSHMAILIIIIVLFWSNQ